MEAIERKQRKRNETVAGRQRKRDRETYQTEKVR